MQQDEQLTFTEIALLSDCVDAIGSEAFPARFCAFGSTLAGTDEAHLSAFFKNATPAEIYSTQSDEKILEALTLYLDVAFVLDPFYRLFLKQAVDRVDRLSDIAPDDFYRSEYYAKFYRAMSFRDECGVLLYVSADAALFLSLGMRKERLARIDRLRSFLRVIAALARRHWGILTPDRYEGAGRLSVRLEQAFNAFGSSLLSPREAEIARMILRGHSSKAIARNLGNSPETIKVHRKRIYSKLKITSQGELLSLFLAALRELPARASGDPLLFAKELVEPE